MAEHKLIVIEGIDGSGKGTQYRLLLNYLQKIKIDHASFDFPQYGKTFFGNFIRNFLDGKFGHFSRNNPYLTSFPYAGDRWQAKDIIWKALNEKKLILCNRYTTSSIYQSVKLKKTERQKFIDWVENLEYEVFGLPRPGLVLFLNVPLVFSQNLISKKFKDQYENNVAYLKKVENMYLEKVKKDRKWINIDCIESGRLLSPEHIHQKIIRILEVKGYLTTTVQV